MSDSEEPSQTSVRDYLLYGLSVPERALRMTVGAAGGVVRESASLLVPQAFQDSKTYSVLVRQTLSFLVEDVGRVAHPGDDNPDEPVMEDFVARKTVGNFVEMAGLATLHLSPVMLLAVVSDVAYGTKSCLHELADELKREGIIDENTTVDSVGDFLDAISSASGVAASAFNTPPISIDGLREMIDETRTAVGVIDPTKVLPQAEAMRMWEEMREIANRDGVSLLEVSSAMTMHSLDKVATFSRGALTSTRAIGRLFDRHVLEHYRTALGDLRENGFYATLATTSEPYIEAVWTNFSTDKPTVTEDLLSGKLVGKAAQTALRWLGIGSDDGTRPEGGSNNPTRPRAGGKEA